MPLVDGVRVEPGFLKLAIDIAGVDRISPVHGLAPALQDVKPSMGLCRTIQIEPVAIEAPGPDWMGPEGLRTGDSVEVDPLPPKRRVCLPAALFTPKVWQTGVDTDASAGRNYQRIGLGDKLGSLSD